MDFAAKIQECIRIVREAGTDDEFILRYLVDWSAGVGNPSSFVALGEASPIFQSGDHDTPEAAVDELLEILRRTGGVPPDNRTDEQKRRDAQTVEEYNAEEERLDAEARARGEVRISSRKIRAADIVAQSIAAPPIDALRGPGLMSGDVVADRLAIRRDDE